MKKIIAIFTSFICILFFATTVFANGAGLPPFLRINGKFASSNPLQLFGITAQSFLIPQDIAPDSYLVNTSINFEIDTSQLKQIVSESLLQNTKYKWDFGDGTTGEGMSNSHTYAKSGSYILVLKVDVYLPESSTPTEFIDSFLITVLPDKSYKTLPKAVIKLNGRFPEDPLKVVQHVNFNKTVIFDASNSRAPSGKIVQYLWNFGDGQTSTEKVTAHKYGNEKSFNTVVLRVRDNNGFISDDFVGIKNDPNAVDENTVPEQQDFFAKYSQYIIAISLFIIVLGLVIFFRRK